MAMAKKIQFDFITRSCVSLLLLTVLLFMLFALLKGTTRSTDTVIPMDVDTTGFVTLLPSDCQKQTIHFYSESCPSCQQVEHVLKNLTPDARRCWLGVAMGGKEGSARSLFGNVYLDHDGRAAIDWGVRRVPTTFWLDSGKVMRVLRDAVTHGDIV